jgi:hypothetical protein
LLLALSRVAGGEKVGQMRTQLLRPKEREHHVVVYDNRPPPERPTLVFDAFFFAVCDCGWLSSTRQSSEEAFADARAHSRNVAEHVARTFG